MPAFAPLCILAGVGVAHRTERGLSGLQRGRHRWAAVAAIVLAGLVLWEVQLRRVQARLEVYPTYYEKRAQTRSELADWINHNLDDDERVAIGDVGLVGWEAKARIVDVFCLNSHVFTSEDIGGKPEAFVDWLLESKPEAIAVISHSRDTLEPHPQLSVYPDLIERDAFREGYDLAAKFGHPPDVFYYWVYTRRDGPSSAGRSREARRTTANRR